MSCKASLLSRGGQDSIRWGSRGLWGVGDPCGDEAMLLDVLPS